jgi:tetratricopeptide (TPR) repeat protein
LSICFALVGQAASSAHRVAGRTALALLAICAALAFAQTSAAPQPTVLAIQELIQSGRLDQALTQLSAALASWPGDGGLFNLRGVVHAQQNELAEARADFEQAVKLSPDLIPAWRNLARACSDADLLCASNAWQRVLKTTPADAEAWFSLAVLDERQGKYAASIRDLESLSPEERVRSQALALHCADLVGLQRPREARDMAGRLTKAAEFSDEDVRTVLPLLKDRSQAPLAVLLVEALDARGAASADSLSHLVLAYEQLNRPADARKTLERVALADPRNPQHLFELARVAYKMHDFEGALGYLGHARDLAPQDPRVHFLFGMVLQEMNLPIEARQSVEKAVALDPGNPDYNYGLGSIILATREASGAVPCFRNYVAARPRDPRGHFALGVAYFATGDYANSRAEMQTVSSDPSTEAGAAYFLGRMARIDEKYEEAAALFKRSIRLLPAFPESWIELARVRLRQGFVNEARTDITQALALDPENFQANSALMALYQKTHDPRAEQQSARLQKLDQERSKRQQLMYRSIEVKPY